MGNIKSLKIFIDSNILFSAIYKKGVCSELLRCLFKTHCEIVISELVLEEVITNIKNKIPKTLPRFIEYVNTIKPIVVKNPSKITFLQYKNLADKNDLPILISAIEYSCEYFVTGNIKDFQKDLINKKYRLIVITPRECTSLINN